jgi:hypothetical protein
MAEDQAVSEEEQESDEQTDSQEQEDTESQGQSDEQTQGSAESEGDSDSDSDEGSSDDEEGSEKQVDHETVGEYDVDEVDPSERAEDEDEARAQMKKLEKEGPPEHLGDWPTGKAMYLTFGGAEGEEGYEDGQARQMGPSSLRHYSDGSVEVQGEMTDDPDQYKRDESVTEEADKLGMDKGAKSEGGDEDSDDEESSSDETQDETEAESEGSTDAESESEDSASGESDSDGSSEDDEQEQDQKQESEAAERS